MIKQKVRAVSSTFGCHKAGGRKDQSLHSDVNFQLLKDGAGLANSLVSLGGRRYASAAE